MSCIIHVLYNPIDLMLTKNFQGEGLKIKGGGAVSTGGCPLGGARKKTMLDSQPCFKHVLNTVLYHCIIQSLVPFAP